MAGKDKPSLDDQILAELVTIKRLLIFALLPSEASQKDVAAALGVNQSSISRMFSERPEPAKRSRAR